MMYFDSIKMNVIAPHFVDQEWTEAEVLGSAVWLWMNSENHRNLPLHTLSVALLPAIKNKQFILAFEDSKPVFFVSWANMSTEAEARYLSSHQLLMTPEDWRSGDRIWIVDWVAPFGHTKKMGRFLGGQLAPSACARSLYHRAKERGRRVQYFFGDLVSPQERHLWKQAHPLAGPVERQ